MRPKIFSRIFDHGSTLKKTFDGNLSAFPKKNPYYIDGADERFKNYSILTLRILNDSLRLKGPASVVFPGIPIKVFNSSNAAFLTLNSKVTHTFIDDAYTELRSKNLDYDTYPMIKAPGLWILYEKFLQKNNKANPVIMYNETAITDIDEVMPCIIDLDKLGKSIELICACKELAKSIDQIVLYKKDQGIFVRLVIEDESQPEAKFSSLVESPNKIIDLFSRGKVRAGGEVKFGRNVLTKDNFDNDLELRKFADDCYNHAVQEVAFYMVAKKDNDYVFSDPFNSPLLEILTKDAHRLISEVGEEKIISAFQISDANPETSVRNPLLNKSFQKTKDTKHDDQKSCG